MGNAVGSADTYEELSRGESSRGGILTARRSVDFFIISEDEKYALVTNGVQCQLAVSRTPSSRTPTATTRRVSHTRYFNTKDFTLLELVLKREVN